MKTNVLTDAEYTALKARYDAFEAWRNGRTSYQTSEIPAGLDVSNDERSKLEVYEFVKNPPVKYFAYVRRVNTQGQIDAKSLRVQITTWTGEILGTGILGRGYESPSFGRSNTRYPVLKFKAINGRSYFGTFFASAGDYCRLKLAK